MARGEGEDVGGRVAVGDGLLEAEEGAGEGVGGLALHIEGAIIALISVYCGGRGFGKHEGWVF